MKFTTKNILISSAIAVGIITTFCSLENVSSGEFVRIQSPTGSFTWYTAPGIKFKTPFLSTTNTYNEISTVAITDDEEVLDSASATMPPLAVQFADTYGGNMEATFRMQLPSDPEKLELIHRSVKNQNNLEGNTLITFAKDMLSQTTDQFLASNFMQGGRGAFKQRLKDQADNGMLVTKRVKKEVTGNVADQGLDGERSQDKTAKQYAYQVEVQLNSDGKQKRRPHNLEQYGIKVTQISLGDFVPEKDLKAFIDTKKERERLRAGVIADQNLERDKAVTEQLRGERERIQAKNKALMAKEAKVIKAQEQVALAEQEKLRQVQVKQKELAIAQANKGIEKANADAAKYQAQVVTEKGMAEAKVIAAKLNAKNRNKDIYIAEMNKEINLAKYRALQNFTVQMPQYVSMGSSDGVNKSLAEMSNMVVLDKLETSLKVK